MNILVTRPKGKGENLVRLLAKVADSVHYQPMVTIAPGPDLAKVADYFAQQQWRIEPLDSAIFVSGFAVDYWIETLKSPQSLTGCGAQWLAVGQATADKLSQWANQTVITPTLETSEGLLALPQLQAAAVAGNNIMIVSGVGGRQTLAQQLQARGAKVGCWQLYQRIAATDQGELWFEQWQASQIDCIVVTSVEILTAVFDSLPPRAHDWLRANRWIVASERIAVAAGSLGIDPSCIYDAKGASDQAVLAQVQRLIENTYVKTTAI